MSFSNSNPLSSSSFSSSSSSSSSSSVSWRTHKERAKSHFSSGRYREALAEYRSALETSPRSGGSIAIAPGGGPPDSERQVLLSNAAACRLKVVQEESPEGTMMTEGERKEMCELAVEEAKQCIALNDKWAKGHVRLASAYIALGGKSNDACNALQRALALDPGNTNARQMLMKELRRDRERNGGNNGSSGGGGGGAGVGGSGAGSSSGSRGGPEPSAPPFEGTTTTPDFAAGGGGGGIGSSGYSAPPPSAPPAHDDYRGPDDYTGSVNDSANPFSSSSATNASSPDDGLDDSPTFSERVQFRMARLWAWWEGDLSDDSKTLIKVSMALLVMYIALGGRFGLDSALGGGGSGNKGSYEPGSSAYDRYYGRGTSSSSAGSSTGSQRHHYRDSYHTQHAGHATNERRSSYGNHRRASSNYDDDYSRYDTGYNDRSSGRYGGSSSGHYGSSYGGGSASSYDDYSSRRSGRSGRSGSTSYHMPNLFDGSLPSMAILAVIAYACHHFGVNPFHALMMLNMVTGNRHRGRGMGMRNMGMMGMGYGMMRNGGAFGRRRQRMGGG